MTHEIECPLRLNPHLDDCDCLSLRAAYQRGREDEKAIWMNPCLECGMDSWSTYICEECATARGDEPIAVGIVDKGITGPSIDAQSCICQPTNICSRTCGMFACEHVGCTIQGEHEHNGGAARGDGEQA